VQAAEGLTQHPSQIGRNGLDGVYTAGNAFELAIEDVKKAGKWRIGQGVTEKLAWNGKLFTWQGTPRYILGQADLAIRHGDAAVQQTGQMILDANVIQSNLALMDDFGNFTTLKLGTMERFDDFWLLEGTDDFFR
jgi:hypothetical protein